MAKRKPAPADADANKAYLYAVRMAGKYGLLLGNDPDHHAMIATPEAQRRAQIRRAVLRQCRIEPEDAPKDTQADQAYTEIVDTARAHALITSAYAGNVSIATPETQREDGTRGRVLTMHRMTETAEVAQ